MPLELKKISAQKFKSLGPEKTVFFFPVAPLEDHGPHLPIGLDLMEAERLSFLAAEKLENESPDWTGVVMPAAPLGIDSNTSTLAIRVRPHVVRDWLVDSCSALIRAGFRHFVCFSGHPGPRQLTAIEEAGKMLKRKTWARGKKGPVLLSATSAAISFKEVLDSPIQADPNEHGGKRDTSIGLSLAKDSVDPSYLNLPARSRGDSRIGRVFARFTRRCSGYWGSPAEASAENGQLILGRTINHVFPKLRSVWDGQRPRSNFRSWYSLIPPNWSFFKAWIMIIIIFLMMLAWVYVGLNY